ncbi:MAG TPA: cytochrome c-type biogenesis protein CcmH [Gemmatimonadaceae bacterium]
MTTRREFVASLAAAGALAIAPRRAVAMQETTTGAANVPMEQDAYRPVRLPEKPNSVASMTDEQRDDLEHRIKCQCGCVLDVFTCRTTDFSCAVSPAMHRDVMSLVNGGYNAAEIMSAFQAVYGERVLMAPLKQGFNWLGYLMPFAAIIGGGGIVAMLIRNWGRRGALAPVPQAAGPIDATDEEMRALNEALRDDS